MFNITEHVQGVQYLLRCWRLDGVLNLNTHFYSVVFDLFCIFRENTNEQQLIQAKILYQCPSRNILDFVYGGSHFSTGVIFLRFRHVKNRLLWHFFYTWDMFFYGKGSFPYDEKWPLGRFSTGVVIRRYRQDDLESARSSGGTLHMNQQKRILRKILVITTVFVLTYTPFNVVVIILGKTSMWRHSIVFWIQNLRMPV